MHARLQFAANTTALYTFAVTAAEVDENPPTVDSAL
jgi:hypothetical protein